MTPIQSYTVRSFQKPSFTVGVGEYLNINDISYRPGLLSWNPIDVTLVDPENSMENNTRLLYEIMKRSGYVKDVNDNKPQSAIIKKTIAANIGAGDPNYGGQIIFDQINSHGDSIEQWVLWNPFIVSVNFGQANYASDELMLIAVNIRYDFAEHRQETLPIAPIF